MNENFKLFKLGELAEIIAGGDKPKIFTERKSNINCIPVVANGENKDGLLGYTDLPKIVEAAVTISARGSKVGFAAIRKQPFFPIVRLLTLIPIKERLYVDFLYYKLKQNRQGGTGSGQPQITIPDISNKSISIPSLPTQKKIAAVLSALDDKIELNNQINMELEAMAKTLYDYWFVQFDFPVTKNGHPELVEGYKSSGGKMVFDETLKREIPEGWEVKIIGDIISKIESGKRPKGGINKNLKIGIPSLGAESIDKLGVFNFQNTKYIPFEYKNKITSGIIQDNDILIYKDGAYVGKTTLFRDDFPYEFATINEHVFLVRTKQKEYQEYLLFTLMQDYYFDIMQSLGQKAAQPGLNQEDLKSIKILVPNKQVILNFQNKIINFLKKIFSNSKQNQELAQLRDWLLPMLMNGQVTVGDAEGMGMVAEEKSTYSKKIFNNG